MKRGALLGAIMARMAAYQAPRFLRRPIPHGALSPADERRRQENRARRTRFKLWKQQDHRRARGLR